MERSPLSLTPIPKSFVPRPQKGPKNIESVCMLLGKLGLVKTNESNFKEEREK